MKAKISFAVRSSTAPGESAETLVPVIVDRRPPVSLTKVVENAIDRGLIVGPKTSAAEEIARGIADQIYKEFCEGRGVKFGEYFYGRPYLDGTCGPNGNLTKANNSVNARLYKGADFNLSLSDFSFEFEGADDQPKIEWLLPTGTSGAPTRNVLEEGKPVSAFGKFLKLDGDTVRLEFKEVGGEAAVDVTTFTAAGPDVLTFPWPATLDASKSYAVTVYRTQEDGTVRTSNSKRVTVRAGEPPAPVGEPEITGVKSGDGPDGTVNLNGTLYVEGTNLETATAVELQDEHNETFATVPVTFADGKLTGTVSGVSGAPGMGYVKVTTSGGSDAYSVEYTGG